jgi:hypothetical protein
MGESEGAAHQEFCRTLTHEDRMLLVLREELYAGSWDRMQQDLHDRLKTRPYVFKFSSRIKEDLARIDRLLDYEKKHGVNLAEFLGKGGE